jgi:hypothetical protein
MTTTTVRTLDQVLGYENLTGIIQDPKGGVSADLLPAGFTSITRRVEGDSAKYTRVAGNRQTARVAQYGSPSQKRALHGVSEVPVKLLHTVEHIYHDVTTLNQLRRFDNPAIQQLGQQEVGRQTGQFRRLFNNLRLATIYSTLATGAVYFDRGGNLKTTTQQSSGGFDVSFGIPAGNQEQLDFDGSGDIIDASWAAGDTDVVGQVAAVKTASRKLTGYRLRHVFYGSNILSYLLNNEAVQQMLAVDATLAGAVSRREIPDGFLGLSWHPAYEAFYIDEDGQVQSFFGQDTCVFTPEPSPEWWEILEGSYQVPAGVGAVGRTASDVIGQFQTVYGMFSHATISTDPPSIKHVAGDTFLPTLKVPGAVFIADVNPG